MCLRCGAVAAFFPGEEEAAGLCAACFESLSDEAKAEWLTFPRLIRALESLRRKDRVPEGHPPE